MLLSILHTKYMCIELFAVCGDPSKRSVHKFKGNILITMLTKCTAFQATQNTMFQYKDLESPPVVPASAFRGSLLARRLSFTQFHLVLDSWAESS